MEEYKCGERVDRLGAEPGQGMGEQIEELSARERATPHGVAVVGPFFPAARMKSRSFAPRATDPQNSGGERLVSRQDQAKLRAGFESVAG